MTTKSKLTIDKSVIIPLTVAIIAIIFGVNNFTSQWAYSEHGHNYLFWGYMTCCALLFILIRLKKIVLIVPLAITMIIIILYANQKFEWRKDYIVETKAGNPFVLMPYIDGYPTYEDHLFWFLNNKPRYINFSNECFKPALNNQQAGRDCNNKNQIYDAYKIDVVDLIESYYQKMKYTARKIETNAFKNTAQFEQCLRDRQCVMIPLLPAGTDEISAKSPEYIGIRNQFWSLIEDNTISAENCDFVDLCRAMRSLGVYTVQEKASQ